MDLNGDFETAYYTLRRFIEENGRDGALIALSGGVDSSTLAAICYDVLGEKAVAATAKSPTYPAEEMDQAKRIANEIGLNHYIVETNELSNRNFIRNPENRCYYCKKGLLDSLHNLAQKLGLKVIFEGTNFSDLSGHRPGFKAIRERENVLSPLAENTFTKERIRMLSRRLGLTVHDKPALACLASRIPFGEKITDKKLKRVEHAEQIVKRITGVRQIRVRDHNGLARIEVWKNERSLLLKVELIEGIAKELKDLGFKFVTLDLEGYRTGSMLERQSEI